MTLSETVLAKAPPNTIRPMLFKIGAVALSNTGQMCLREAGFPRRRAFGVSIDEPLAPEPGAVSLLHDPLRLAPPDSFEPLLRR